MTMCWKERAAAQESHHMMGFWRKSMTDG